MGGAQVPSAVTDLVRLGSFDQRGGGDECQDCVDEVVDQKAGEVDCQEDAPRAMCTFCAPLQWGDNGGPFCVV